jgi:hypothetical protein
LYGFDRLASGIVTAILQDKYLGIGTGLYFLGSSTTDEMTVDEGALPVNERDLEGLGFDVPLPWERR